MLVQEAAGVASKDTQIKYSMHAKGFAQTSLVSSKIEDLHKEEHLAVQTRLH